MEYKIRNILESPTMKDSKLVAGERGLSNTISDIIIMEAHDVKNWLKPNQLVLTSLYSLKDSSEEECVDLIREMFELEASGLIVKLGRFVDDVPPGLILGGKKYNLPVILIQEKVEYRDIVLEVMHNVMNRKAEMLDIFQNVHHEFKNLSLQHAPIPSILEALKRLIGTDVLIVSEDRKIIESTIKSKGKIEVKDSRQLFNESYMTYRYTRELIKKNGELSSQLIAKIDLEDNTFIYLVIREIDKFVLMHDYMAIENACSSLQFEYAKELALSKVKQSHMNDLVDQILNEKYQDREELLDLVHLLQLSSDKSYRVVTWMHRPDLAGEKMSFTQREQLLSDHYSLVKQLEVVWPRFAYRIFVNRLTFIIEDNFKSDHEFKRYISDSLSKLHLKRLDKLSMKVGISEKGDIFEISKYAIQPLKVIQIGRIQDKEEFVMLYNDLGVYRLFFDLRDSIEAGTYVRKEIMLMDKSDEDTLRVFLDHNQNYTQASEILFVHPKTVKYRISKMKDSYDFDFDDPTEMFQLMLELRIKQFSKI